jgi:hypothetical protein
MQWPSRSTKLERYRCHRNLNGPLGWTSLVYVGDTFGIEDAEIALWHADSVTVGQICNDAVLPQEGPVVLQVQFPRNAIAHLVRGTAVRWRCLPLQASQVSLPP